MTLHSSLVEFVRERNEVHVLTVTVQLNSEFSCCNIPTDSMSTYYIYINITKDKNT